MQTSWNYLKNTLPAPLHSISDLFLLTRFSEGGYNLLSERFSLLSSSSVKVYDGCAVNGMEFLLPVQHFHSTVNSSASLSCLLLVNARCFSCSKPAVTSRQERDKESPAPSSLRSLRMAQGAETHTAATRLGGSTRFAWHTLLSLA